MPTIATASILMVAGAMTVRAMYHSGNESIQKFAGKIVNFFHNILSFFQRGVEPGKEYAEREIDEIKKEVKQMDDRIHSKEREMGERDTGQPQKDGLDGMRTELPFSKKESVSMREERQEVLRRFVPANWKDLSMNEREYVARKLFEQAVGDMGLSKTYSFSFSDRTIIDFQNASICIDRQILESEQWEASIELYNSIIKQAAYARQNEAMEGLVNPTKMELKLAPVIMECMAPRDSYVSMQQSYFLGKKVYPIQRQEASPYISAGAGSTVERQALEILQPSERIPNMMKDMYYEQLQNVILDTDDERIGERELNYLEQQNKLSYEGAKDMLTALYNLHGKRTGIEAEIDKVMRYHADQNPMKQEPKYLNKKVQLAVAVAQIQTRAEEQGKEYKDPRDKIVKKIGKEIDTMSEKYYSADSGMLHHYGIEVKNVVSHEEWEASRPKKGEGRDKDKSESENPKDDINKEPREKEPEAGEAQKPNGADADSVHEEAEGAKGKLEEENTLEEADYGESEIPSDDAEINYDNGALPENYDYESLLPPEEELFEDVEL